MKSDEHDKVLEIQWRLQLTDELRDHNCYHHLAVYINHPMSHDQDFETSLKNHETLRNV